MKHTTTDEWSEEIRDTQIFLRRHYDIYNKTDVFELVLCDKIDSHCKFWFRGSLADVALLADKIKVITGGAKC